MLTPMTDEQFTKSLVVKCANLEVSLKALEKQNGKLEEIIECELGEKVQLKNTILRFKHLAEVVAQNPGWNDHHCRAQAMLDEYAKHINSPKGDN